MPEHVYTHRVEEAAKQPHPDPSPKQQDAGNFRKGHFHAHGLKVTIETSKGQWRTKYNDDGSEKFTRLMHAHYGYIRQSLGADDEPIDVFIGPHPEAQLVFVLNQLKVDGSFDEHKVLLGVLNAKEAKELYLKHYPDDWKGFGGMKSMTMEQFKEWVFSGKKNRKVAALLPEVQLQPHQQKIEDQAIEHPLRKLLVHGLGSGKSLSSIAAAEAQGGSYTAVVPASLRANFNKELDKFTDRETPADVLSYTQVAKGHPVDKLHTLIADESQRLREPGSKQTVRMSDLASQAEQLLLLSGSPIVNRPSDLAPLISMLTGQHMSPEAFNAKFVGTKKTYPSVLHRLFGATPGEEETVENPDELKQLLKGHVDWYAPDKPVVPTTYKDVPVEMSTEQTRIYRALWDKLPWVLRYKLKNQFNLNKDELAKMRSFLVGPRQVGLSTQPFLRSKNPLTAFGQSTKLQKAYELLQDNLKDPRTKALVFSNFIDAGLTPYAAKLQQAGIPHGMFHGGLSDVERKKLVDDFNDNKLRVALLGPSGAEGLSFKGTQLIQLLDPHFQPTRGRQSVGRGLRFDSHTDLPDELKNVAVQRFSSRLPLGFMDTLLSRLGFDRSKSMRASDDYLTEMTNRKEKFNQKFMNILKEVGQQKQGADDKYAANQPRVRVVMPYENQYLLEELRNPKYPQNLGKTRFPGGGVEAGETPQQAAAREMQEELGVKIDPATLEAMGHRVHPEWGHVEHYYRLPKHTLKPGQYNATAGGDALVHLIAGMPEGEKYFGADLTKLVKPNEARNDRSGEILAKMSRMVVNLHCDDLSDLVAQDEAISVYTRRQKLAASILGQLQQAKTHSDANQWSHKHRILNEMMAEKPDDWFVDQDLGGHVVGITHRKTGYRFHIPRHLVAGNIKREHSQKAA